MTSSNIHALKLRLERAEALIDALRGNEVDAGIRKDGVALLLLQQAEGALQDGAAHLKHAMGARAREQQKATGAAAAQTALDIVNAMGEGVLLFRPDGTITTVNPAFESLTALRRKDVVGTNLRTLMPRLLEGDDLAMALRAIEEVAQGRTPSLNPLVLKMKKDTVTPVTVSPSLTLIRSGDGAPVYAVLTLKDVTELHQAGELLNKIFDNTHLQIVYLDNHFHFVRVNRAYAQAGGQALDFFSGKYYFDLYPNPGIETIFRKVRDTGAPYTVFGRAFQSPERPERDVQYYDWSVRPIRNEKGVTEGLLLCLLDVTETVRARQKLAESEQKYRELVEQADSIIMRITPDHRILFFNEYAQQFFGYSADEILGRSVLGTIVPTVDSDGRDLKKMTQKITAHPERHGVNENENSCKDGRRVWIHWANRTVRDERGHVKELLCVGTDITERVRLEREAAAYRSRLRRMAAQLVAIEEQDRRRMATQIHDTVVQTLSLANMRLGGMRAAADDVDPGGRRKTIDGVRKLLETGIAECRNLMADLTPPLLYELGLVPALKDYAERQKKRHELDLEIEEESPPRVLDENRSGLLFLCARELVMNAVKYAGPCRIRIRLLHAESHVRLQVSDTGRGFDPALFGSCNSAEKGGFGLFNLRERLDRLGGRLAIDSAPGKGTVATVVLPVAG